MGKFLGFVATFCILFAITVMFMAAVDALPEQPATSNQQPTTGTQPPMGEPQEPTRVVAADIGLDVSVENPTTTDVDELDAVLLKGALRYPGSGLLGENGTVLLFGHSSYLPIVYNQNYKAFNGIQKLKPEAIISVYSGTQEYRYRVVGVRQVNLANADESIVELRSDNQYLVLVTCDSFASKSDRFVVTAVRAY